MPHRYVCPECGARYIEDHGACLGCLCELLPDTSHVPQMTSDELTGPERAIEMLMRQNRGCTEAG